MKLNRHRSESTQMTDARMKTVIGRWVKSEWLMAVNFRDNWYISWKRRPVKVVISAPHTKPSESSKLYAKEKQQDKNRSGGKRDRVGQIALWAWSEESLARMLLAQVLTTKTTSMSKEGVYGSAPALLRTWDSGCSSWRAGWHQEVVG